MGNQHLATGGAQCYGPSLFLRPLSEQSQIGNSLTMAPKYTRSQSLEPGDITLQGERVFEDMIKDLYMGRLF